MRLAVLEVYVVPSTGKGAKYQVSNCGRVASALLGGWGAITGGADDPFSDELSSTCSRPDRPDVTFLKRRAFHSALPAIYIQAATHLTRRCVFNSNEKERTIMDRMLVVVFDNESKACEGSRALQQLDEDGSIAVYAARVVAKNPDGTAA